MKPSEIKALREANTIKEVVAMVDCREFEHNAKDEAAHIQHHLMLQYNNRILDGMPEAAALNHAKASAVHANGGTVAQQTEFWRDADAAMGLARQQNAVGDQDPLEHRWCRWRRLEERPGRRQCLAL